MTSTSARASAVLAAAALALIAAPAATNAAPAPVPPAGDPVTRSLAGGGDGLAPSTDALGAAHSARPAPASADRFGAPARTAPRSAPRTAARSAAAAADCNAIAFTENLSHDPQVTLSWSTTDFGPYRLDRQRDGGAWSTRATNLTGTSFRDTGINTHGLFIYRLVAADTTECYSSVPLSMSTFDGWGYAEAVTGTYNPVTDVPGALMLQDEFALADDTTLTGVDPAFSPDGRRLAASVSDGAGHLGLAVDNVSTRAQERRVPKSGGDVDALDAAWSPDGTRLAYTEYLRAAGGDTTSLWVLDVRTGARSLVTGSSGLVQPDWRSATSLVAAAAGALGTLVTIPAAGGARAPIAGTNGGQKPQVEGTSGRIWFSTDDGTTSELRTYDPATTPAVRTVRSSMNTIYGQVRILATTDPLATRYFWVEVDTAGTRNDAGDDTFTVVENEKQPDGSYSVVSTPIGAGRTNTDTFWGFDLRRPLSKGTSQLALDGNSDLLAQDSKGGLFVYPVTDTAQLGGRITMGSGFTIYNTTYIPGDLNGDNTADLLSRDSSGVLWMYPGRGNGTVGARVRLGSGWSSYTFVDTGDWNGDGRADLVARDGIGYLWMYPGNGAGGFGARLRIGSGWTSMNAILGGGDFTLDGAADIISRDQAGYLWLYPGNGTGGFKARTRIGRGWGQFSQITSPELTGLSPVVYAKNAAGQILMFVGTGDGRFDNNLTAVVGNGFGSYRITS